MDVGAMVETRGAMVGAMVRVMGCPMDNGSEKQKNLAKQIGIK